MPREDSIEIDLAPLAASTEPQVRILDRFAGYEVLGRQAVVGMFELLVVRDRSASGRGRLLMLRVMRPRFAQDPFLARTFALDARVALRLSHPNLTSAHRAGVESGMPFVALELVHGTSVRELITRATERGGVLVPTIAAAIAATLADAMHWVHLARARATDVRPGPRQDLDAGDVLIAQDGTVKLLATPRDAENDVFALGLLLHEMLTGRRPSVRALDAEPRAWPRAVPAGLRSVLDRALADDELERYPSAAAMRQDLVRWLEEERADVRPARIADAIASLGGPARPLDRGAIFTPLRSDDETGTHVLAKRASRRGRTLLVLVLALATAALVLAWSHLAG